MKVLVTGGIGYVGSRIVAFLDTLGVYDLTVTTRRIEIPEEIKHLSRVKICQIDYSNTDHLTELLKGQEVIINLAAANEILAGKNPISAIEQTAGNTWQLLKAIDDSSLKYFMQFSTIHVYGSPLPYYIDESSPVNPGHGYAIAHIAAEQLVAIASNNKKFKHLIVRMSNAIGTPLHANIDRWSLLVNDLCLQAVRDGKLTLKSNGRQWRNFIALEEVCRFVQQAIESSQLETERYSGLINLVGNYNMSVLDMAKLVQSRYELIYGKTIPLFVPTSEEDAIFEPLLISRTKLVRWYSSESYTLEHEIDDLLAYCNNNKKLLPKN